MAKRNRVINQLAIEHGVDAKDIIGNGKKRNVVLARKRGYKALQDMGWTLSVIGRMMGNRDHSTISHGIRSLQP